MAGARSEEGGVRPVCELDTNGCGAPARINAALPLRASQAMRSGLSMTSGRPRVVLDTNVAVALLVFRDPRLEDLAMNWEAHAFEAVVDAATLGEFERVLRYPELKLDEAGALRLANLYRERCLVLPERAGDDAALPRCADPDDQMFLSLAHAANAAWLLTRDKALLDVRRRTRFRITLPEAFVVY